jgi:hypothetical protein
MSSHRIVAVCPHCHQRSALVYFRSLIPRGWYCHPCLTRVLARLGWGDG